MSWRPVRLPRRVRGARARPSPADRRWGSGGGGSSTRARGTSTRSGRKRRSSSKRAPTRTRRPAPRAVRSGPGPVFRGFAALGRGVAAVWLGIAHAIGAVARSIGRSARDLDPEQRRDGVGLFVIGLAVVAAAAVWWQLPGAVMESVRTVVAGSVGKVGWLVPLMLVLIGWRNMRDPERNGPAGRQVVGWVALAFGVLGIVHIANGSPQPELGDASDLQQAGGAVGFVVASLLLDLLRTPYVVVPLLALLCAVRRPGDHRDARLPGAAPPRRAARPPARPLAGRRPRRRPRRGRADPADPGPRVAALARRVHGRHRHRPRDGRPGLRLARSWRTARCGAAAASRPTPTATAEVAAVRRRRAGAAPHTPLPAAGRAARAVGRHRLLAAGQRRAARRLAPQGAVQGQRRGGRAAHPGDGGVRASTPRSRATPAARP